jgi:hypothetical protein
MLHSGNIGNISTAFRSENEGKKLDYDGQNYLPSDNDGVHFTSQINFRTGEIPFSNSFIETYKLKNAEENYTFSLGVNTMQNYPRFDCRKLTTRASTIS